MITPLFNGVTMQALPKTFPFMTSREKNHSWNTCALLASARCLAGVAPWLELEGLFGFGQECQMHHRECASLLLASIVDPSLNPWWGWLLDSWFFRPKGPVWRKPVFRGVVCMLPVYFLTPRVCATPFILAWSGWQVINQRAVPWSGSASCEMWQVNQQTVLLSSTSWNDIDLLFDNK
jgi:hypothetical protein